MSAQLKEEAAKVKAASNKDKAFTSMDFLTRAFKKPSAGAAKQGKARLLLEDMIRRTERKLEELKRKSHTQTLSTEEKAEELAEELYHKPGSLLTKEEKAQILIESECREPLPRQRCNRPNINKFRTINGVCNNLANPLQGAAETPFRRLVPPIYEDGISAPLGRYQAQSLPEEGEGEGENSQEDNTGPFIAPKPSARLVSKSIVRDRDQEENPFTHILMQWGQFLDHDMDLGPELEEECEGCEFTEICEPIFVPKDDQVFGVGTPRNGECLPFRRSTIGCPIDPPNSFSPREQINDLTSYIDGSMIYGSSLRVEVAVRDFRNGLLKVGTSVDGRESLPVDTQGIVACPNRMDCFLCGDLRCNEQISLTVMHTLWLRAHNTIARGLRVENPSWGDERLFQEARKIVGALIQKITYIDYLPKVLGQATFDQVIGRFRRYDRRVDASVPNAFATAAYRYGHSLIRPVFDRLNGNYQPINIGPLNLRDAFFNPPQFRISRGTDPILRGLVTVNSRRVDEFLNNVLTTQLFETDSSPGMDLAALNIQRSRDHGLAGYQIWRNFCQRIFNLTSDVENQLTFLRFLRLYGSLDNVELWVGGLAEDRLPDSLLGSTFACIFGLTFANVRDGDRFYFEKPGVFTPAQLKSIRRTTLSRVICDNTGIDQIQRDAFRSDQSRVTCSSIPTLDLAPWRVQTKFVRVNTPTISTLFFVAARPTGSEFMFTSNTQDRRCVSFEYGSSTQIVIFANTYNTGCNRLRSTFSSSSLTPSRGFYSTLSECQRGSVAAFTFNGACANEVKAESENNIVPESPDSNTTLPTIPEFDLAIEESSLDISDDSSHTETKISDTYTDEKKLRAELAKELEKLN